MPDVSSTWTVATTLLTAFALKAVAGYPAPETIHRIHQG
jgi:hypothetical protein